MSKFKRGSYSFNCRTPNSIRFYTVFAFCIPESRQLHIFNNPTAPAISATGASRTNPPTKIRQTINIGTAKTSNTVAIIFAVPHVSLNARPIAFISNQMASTEIIISINGTQPPITIICFLYLNPDTFCIIGIVFNFFPKASILSVFCLGYIFNTPCVSLCLYNNYIQKKSK